MRAREELSWVAGFYEGEGTCATYTCEGRKQPRLRISQAHREVLDRVKSFIGFGQVTGPYKHNGWKPLFQYSVSNFEEIQAFMCFIWLFLGPVKKAQFKKVFVDIKNQPRDKRRKRHEL